MTYSVKEIFYTLQGEGLNAGRPAVFCRFTGCNLWSGREEDRATSVCKFCDTDFIGTDGANGGKFTTAAQLVEAIKREWPLHDDQHRFVVITGGEPLLQLDAILISELHGANFKIAVETNGTIPAPNGIDWLCVSPKNNSSLAIQHGHELKLVYPQAENHPEDFAKLDFEHFLLQPMDGPNRVRNTQLAIDFCKANPRWKLSIQTHKVLGIP